MNNSNSGISGLFNTQRESTDSYSCDVLINATTQSPVQSCRNGRGMMGVSGRGRESRGRGGGCLAASLPEETGWWFECCFFGLSQFTFDFYCCLQCLNIHIFFWVDTVKVVMFVKRVWNSRSATEQDKPWQFQSVKVILVCLFDNSRSTFFFFLPQKLPICLQVKQMGNTDVFQSWNCCSLVSTKLWNVK